MPEPDVRGLDEVQERFDRYVAAVVEGCQQAMTEVTALLEAWAKADHLYQDDTGNLTNSIRGYVAEATAALVRGALSASMDYAVFVELANQGKYAFLSTTISKHLDDIRNVIERHLREIRL